MNSKVGIKSLTLSKIKEGDFDFIKYNIEVSIDETENSDSKNGLNYTIIILSEPKNIRISVEGFVEISGNESERAQIFEKDENKIPGVLHLIYQELFPIFFMITKSMNCPCPAYRLSQISPPTENAEKIIQDEQSAELNEIKSNEKESSEKQSVQKEESVDKSKDKKLKEDKKEEKPKEEIVTEPTQM